MEPLTFVDILILPLLVFTIGAIGYGAAYSRKVQFGVLPKSRWIAVAFIGIAALIGLNQIWQLLNPSTGPFYRASLIGMKVYWAHYVSFLIPAAGLIAIFVVERRARLHADD